MALIRVGECCRRAQIVWFAICLTKQLIIVLVPGYRTGRPGRLNRFTSNRGWVGRCWKWILVSVAKSEWMWKLWVPLDPLAKYANYQLAPTRYGLFLCGSIWGSEGLCMWEVLCQGYSDFTFHACFSNSFDTVVRSSCSRNILQPISLEGPFELNMTNTTWWFQILVIFTSIPGEMIQFEKKYTPVPPAAQCICIGGKESPG